MKLSPVQRTLLDITCGGFFIVALAFATVSAWNFWHAKSPLAVSSKMVPTKANPVVAPSAVPIVSVPMRTNEQNSPRLAQVIADAPRAPGNMPLVQAEKLFGTHPDIKSAYIDGSAARIELVYGPFFRNAAMSPSAKADFCSALAKKEEAWADIQSEASDVDALSPELRNKWNQARATCEAALRRLLSLEQYEQYTKYEETVDLRTRMFGLKTLVTTSFYTSPLSAEDFEGVVELVKNSNIYSRDPKLRSDPTSYEALKSAASSLLDNQQQETFELFLDARQIEVGKATMVNAQRLRQGK